MTLMVYASVAVKRRRPWLGIVLIAVLVFVVVLLVIHKAKPEPDQSALDQPTVVTIKAATVRKGDIGIHVDALGTKRSGGADAMDPGAIFRIASITRPVAAAAAMILAGDGKFQLDDPIDAWLPELSNRRVLAHVNAPLDVTIPAFRPISVRGWSTVVSATWARWAMKLLS